MQLLIQIRLFPVGSTVDNCDQTWFLCISQFQQCPYPPEGQSPPRALALFLSGKFPGLGTNKPVKCPGVGPKKRVHRMPHPQDHLESNTVQGLINNNEKVSLIIIFNAVRNNNTPNVYTIVAFGLLFGSILFR